MRDNWPGCTCARLPTRWGPGAAVDGEVGADHGGGAGAVRLLLVRLADYAGLVFEADGDGTADRILDDAAVFQQLTTSLTTVR